MNNLTIGQLKKLCRDFAHDLHDGYVSNDEAWIELWIKKNMKKNKERL